MSDHSANLGRLDAEEASPRGSQADCQTADHTPGPWAWMGNGPHDIYLATTHSGRRYVMGLRRMGVQGAQPVFQAASSRMIPARDLLQFEVGDRAVVGLDAARADNSVYRYDIRGIANADARLIAAAPELLEFARAHEAWEASLIRDGRWELPGAEGLPALTDQLYDAMMTLQAKRNAAIRKATGEQA